MPYFYWQGVNLNGRVQKGTLFARSAHELDAALLKRNIALLAIKETSGPLFTTYNTTNQVIIFLRQMSLLLASGVLLPEALLIVNEHLKHPLFQEVLQHLALQVDQGRSLSSALARYPTFFNHMMVQVIYVGQESGALPRSLTMLADHLEMVQLFGKQLRSVALLPCLTLGFLLTITCGVIIGIIPRFAALLACCNQELPPLTRALITISKYASSWYMLVFIGCSAVVVATVWRYVRSERGAKKRDAILVRMPLIGPLIRQISLYYYLRSLALLLEGGVRLPAAMAIAQYAMPNRTMQEHCFTLHQEVESGSSLSSSMAHCQDFAFDSKLVSMIKIGEESGSLASILQTAGHHYHDDIKRSLSCVTTLFQPVLMIILGLLITVLIVALYTPILQLSSELR